MSHVLTYSTHTHTHTHVEYLYASHVTTCEFILYGCHCTHSRTYALTHIQNAAVPNCIVFREFQMIVKYRKSELKEKKKEKITPCEIEISKRQKKIRRRKSKFLRQFVSRQNLKFIKFKKWNYMICTIEQWTMNKNIHGHNNFICSKNEKSLNKYYYYYSILLLIFIIHLEYVHWISNC